MWYWGSNLVRNFFEIGVLKYVCDLDSISANKISKMYNIESKSFDDILKTDVDGVVIAAPAEQHNKLAERPLFFQERMFLLKNQFH